MDSDILSMLSFIENSRLLWPFAVSFVEISSHVFERQYFEQISRLFASYISGIEKVNFSAIWIFLEKYSTLLGCRVQTQGFTQIHEVSIEKQYQIVHLAPIFLTISLMM